MKRWIFKVEIHNELFFSALIYVMKQTIGLGQEIIAEIKSMSTDGIFKMLGELEKSHINTKLIY